MVDVVRHLHFKAARPSQILASACLVELKQFKFHFFFTKIQAM
jgi:hypothetical protein